MLTEQDRIDQINDEIFQRYCNDEISVDEYLSASFLLTDYFMGSITLKQLNDRIKI